MIAGFSFLSRISKYVMEKCQIFDYSWENYVELEEDNEKREEKLDQLEKNSSNARFIIYKPENSIEMEFKSKSMIDSNGYTLS